MEKAVLLLVCYDLPLHNPDNSLPATLPFRRTPGCTVNIYNLSAGASLFFSQVDEPV